MDALFLHDPSSANGLLIALCLFIAFGFEFANGFHDTANAVATVIYTHSLKPTSAVLLSGLCNFLGVFVGGISVALGIMKLLPVELLVQSGAGIGLAMVLALLLSAIIWNVGTWYFGLPASSSHTLIGAILGVGIANSLRPGHAFGDGVDWRMALEIGLSLVVSPVFGFVTAAALIAVLRRSKRLEALHAAPEGESPPPPTVRALLIATCSGVSFAHGSNDGQKGVGMVMLILIGLIPAGFALNLGAGAADVNRTLRASERIERIVHDRTVSVGRSEALRAARQLTELRAHLDVGEAVRAIPHAERFAVRQAILLADKSVERLVDRKHLVLRASEARELRRLRADLRCLTDYAPRWVLFCIALALGIGTMFGWRRVVTTVGEKIGRSQLTYAQGASAQLVAMGTIGFASVSGLPVSTTHVLSSGIAGTMVAAGAGLQTTTVRNIVLAWVLTLPATVALSAILFTVLRLAMS